MILACSNVTSKPSFFKISIAFSGDILSTSNSISHLPYLQQSPLPGFATMFQVFISIISFNTVKINFASLITFIRRLIFDVAIIVQISYDFMIGCACRNLSSSHNIITENMNRIFKVVFFPVLQQCRINTNVGNANAGITSNSIEKI